MFLYTNISKKNEVSPFFPGCFQSVNLKLTGEPAVSLVSNPRTEGGKYQGTPGYNLIQLSCVASSHAIMPTYYNMSVVIYSEQYGDFLMYL